MATRSSKLGGSAGAVIGYLQDEVGVIDYYASEAEQEGFSTTWGKLAEDFGIENGLTREQFTRLFHGQHPETGEQLAKSGHRINRDEAGDAIEVVATRTPMIDVVYSTPKSVSELLVTASPEMRHDVTADFVGASMKWADLAIQRVERSATPTASIA